MIRTRAVTPGGIKEKILERQKGVRKITTKAGNVQIDRKTIFRWTFTSSKLVIKERILWFNKYGQVKVNIIIRTVVIQEGPDGSNFDIS